MPAKRKPKRLLFKSEFFQYILSLIMITCQLFFVDNNLEKGILTEIIGIPTGISREFFESNLSKSVGEINI